MSKAGRGLFDIGTLPGVWPPVGAAVSGGQWQPRAAKGGIILATKGPGAGEQQKGDQGSGAGSDSSWVRTDQDCWQFFQQAPGQHRFFFCKQLDDTSGRVAVPSFDLAIIDEAEAVRRQEYVTLSPRELVFIAQGKPTETVAAAEYQRLKAAFTHLRTLGFFRNFLVAKHYTFWRRAVLRLRFRSVGAAPSHNTLVCWGLFESRTRLLATHCHRRVRWSLEQSLFLAKPAFCPALVSTQALLHRLTLVDVSGLGSQQRCSLAEFVEQRSTWRKVQAAPAITKHAGAVAKAAEEASSAAEAAATAAKASLKDESELTDRVGVDLYATTTAARARSMISIKQGKIEKARWYHTALAEAAMLPRFIRMVDLLFCEALAALARNTCQAAVAVLQGLQAAAVGDEGGQEQHRGGLLVSTVILGQHGPELAPSEAEWATALLEQVVEGTLGLVGVVPEVAALPAFQRYALAGVQRTAADGLAQADVAVQAAMLQLQGIVRDSFAHAAEAVRQFGPQHEVHVFLTQNWHPDVYAEEQRLVGVGAVQEIHKCCTMFDGCRQCPLAVFVCCG